MVSKLHFCLSNLHQPHKRTKMSHLRHNKHIAPSIRTLYNFCIFLFFVLLTDQSEINQSSSDEATQVANPSYPDEKRLKFPVCCFVDRVVIVSVIVSDRPLFDEVADDCLLNLLTNASAHSWRLTLERPGSSTSCWFLVRSLLEGKFLLSWRLL